MAERTLTALLRAKENITEALENIEDATEEAAEAARNASGSNEQYADTMEKVRDVTQQAATSIKGETNAVEEQEGAMHQLSVAKESVTGANEELSRAAKRTASALDDESTALVEMAIAADDVDELIDQLARSEMVAAHETENLKDEFEDLSVSEMTSSMSTAELTARLRGLSDKLEDVDDKAEDASTGLDRFGMTALSTSLNLGPFNFALRNLLTQMPVLVMTAGAATTALFGLATAALAAGAGIAAIFGGGALAMAKGFAQTSEDIKNTMQGLQKVMKRVGKMFVKALAPLMNAQSIKMFTQFMEGLAVAVNFVAQAAASMQGQLSDWGSALSTSFFENFDEVVFQVMETVEAFMPILARLFDWFMSSLPGAIEFMREKTLEFLPALQSLGESMVDFWAAFTELGITVMKGVIPVLVMVIDFLTGIAQLLNTIPDEILMLVAALAVFGKVGGKLVGIGWTLYNIFGDLHMAIFKTSGALNTLEDSFDAIGGPFNNYANAVAFLRDEMLGLNETMDDTNTAMPRGILSDGGVETDEGGLLSRLRSDRDRDFDMPDLSFDAWTSQVDEFIGVWDSKMGEMKRMASNAFTSIPLFSETTDVVGKRKMARRLARSKGLGNSPSNLQIDDEHYEVEGLRAANARIKKAGSQAKDFIKTVPGRMSEGFRTIGASALDATGTVVGGFSRMGQSALGFAGTLGGGFLTAIGEAQIKAYSFAKETGDEFTSLAADVLNLSGKMNLLKRHADELGMVDWEATLPGGLGGKMDDILPDRRGDAFPMPGEMGLTNASMFENYGETIKKKVDMGEEVHPSQWAPEDEEYWEATGKSNISQRWGDFGFGDTSVAQGASKKLDALKDKVSGLKKPFSRAASKGRELAHVLRHDEFLSFATLVAEDMGRLTSQIADTARGYARLAGVKYQNMKASLGQVMASTKLSDAYTRLTGKITGVMGSYISLEGLKWSNIKTTVMERLANTRLGDAYDRLADSSLINAISRYWDLIKTKAVSYWWNLREIYSTYSLADAFRAVGGAAISAMSGLWSWITSLFVAEETTEELDEEARESALSISLMGAASSIAMLPVMGLSAAVTGLAGALALIGWTEIVVAIGAIMAVAGMAAGALGVMGKSSKETAGMMQFLHGIMSGLMEAVMTVGIPAWNMLVEVIETVLSPFIALNQILTAIGQMLGFIGKNSGFLSSLLRLIAQFLGGVAKIIGWILNKVQQLIDLIPGVDTQSSLSSLKVNEKDVKKGASKAKKKASGKTGMAAQNAAQSGKKDQQSAEQNVTKKQKNVTNNNKKISYNFGDFNMAPENKADVKRMVQDALKEANRNRRLRNGGT